MSFTYTWRVLSRSYAPNSVGASSMSTITHNIRNVTTQRRHTQPPHTHKQKKVSTEPAKRDRSASFLSKRVAIGRIDRSTETLTQLAYLPFSFSFTSVSSVGRVVSLFVARPAHAPALSSARRFSSSGALSLSFLYSLSLSPFSC